MKRCSPEIAQAPVSLTTSEGVNHLVCEKVSISNLKISYEVMFFVTN